MMINNNIFNEQCPFLSGVHVCVLFEVSPGNNVIVDLHVMHHINITINYIIHIMGLAMLEVLFHV